MSTLPRKCDVRSKRNSDFRTKVMKSSTPPTNEPWASVPSGQ